MVLTQKAHTPQCRVADLVLFLKVTSQISGTYIIIYLSHLQGHSINDNLTKTFCSLSYIIVDDAIESLLELDPTPYW